MANTPINDTEYKAFDKEYARSAWLKRQQRYWDSTKGPRFNTHIGEIYEVDFGMNIGDEFSGRHLALCLSDTTHSEERMTVIPLSTKYMEYNLQYEIHVTSYVDDKPIDAGVVLDEPRLISKLRVAKSSTILGESLDDKLIPVGFVEISDDDLARYRSIEV